MKTLTALLRKVFKTQSSEEQLDAYIKSIRQKPQYSDLRVGTSDKKNPKKYIDLESSGSLVLA
ncbi:hypothetical protein [Flavobacterium chryseum]|uniref:hypothetical protein n=1 Tax=Flavobacterium sp. P3160 TaxID=2512113 RepID=UPI00105FB1AE|nr:hypothetical protein [Flavobacterium sp. P3160]